MVAQAVGGNQQAGARGAGCHASGRGDREPAITRPRLCRPLSGLAPATATVTSAVVVVITAIVGRGVIALGAMAAFYLVDRLIIAGRAARIVGTARVVIRAVARFVARVVAAAIPGLAAVLLILVVTDRGVVAATGATSRLASGLASRLTRRKTRLLTSRLASRFTCRFARRLTCRFTRRLARGFTGTLAHRFARRLACRLTSGRSARSTGVRGTRRHRICCIYRDIRSRCGRDLSRYAVILSLNSTGYHNGTGHNQSNRDSFVHLFSFLNIGRRNIPTRSRQYQLTIVGFLSPDRAKKTRNQDPGVSKESGPGRSPLAGKEGQFGRTIVSFPFPRRNHFLFTHRATTARPPLSPFLSTKASNSNRKDTIQIPRKSDSLS